ncbi:MAG: RnfABCDGE type electron transport complex subunit G [Calditrichia bacterium]|nr:RnfABCDGE type electron transport complex subunit G [Calditrichia bacterium]
MGKIIRLGIILSLITIIASYGLAMLYKQTKPQIEKIKMQKINNALAIVLPEANDIETISKKEPVIDPTGKVVAHNEIVEYYIGYNDSTRNEITGYALKASKAGYEAKVETMVGVDVEGVIKKIIIIDQKETPGLGARCTEDTPVDPNRKKWTTEQFIGKTMKQMKVDKDGGEIVSITGATITSRTVANSIKEALEEFLNKKLKVQKVEEVDSVETNVSEEGGE